MAMTAVHGVRNCSWPGLCAFALLLPVTLWAQELAITHVQADRTRAEANGAESIKLRFDLTAPAQVSLRVYDGRDLQVREIPGKALLPAGEHSMNWDLRDQSGKPVPAEAYIYVLEARTQSGTIVRHDLTDITGGETVAVRDVKWDAQRGQLSYVLDRPSRVSVRMGLNEGGPLLRTLLDWVVRPAGLQHESWDGKDASGVLDLAKHPRLAISVQAFALPENSILVGTAPSAVELIPGLAGKAQRREKSAATPKRMYAHAQQPLEARGDFKIQLALPASLPRTPAGIPIASATIPVRLSVAPQDRERALTRRFEPVFFVDGQFAFENEVGFVPMTWNFDPAPLNEGEHFLTVNLRGYEGNFGMATVKVFVKRAASAAAAGN